MLDTRYLFGFILTIVSVSLLGQSKSELKELAVSAESLRDWSQSIELYQELVRLDEEDVKSRYQLAEAFRQVGTFDSAAFHYQKVFEQKPKKYPLALFYQASMLKALDSCKQAIPLFDDFRKIYRGEKDDRKYRRLAKFNIEGCEKVQNQREKIWLKALPPSVNTSRVEGSPIYLSSNEILFNAYPENTPQTYQGTEVNYPKRQFFLAEKNDTSWQRKGNWLEIQIDEELHVVNGTFNPSLNRFYFTVCEADIKKLDCDIYLMEKVGDIWSAPIKLGEEVNSKYIETQPAVGLDEKGRETLYFVTDRKDGKGGKDIWYSTYYENKSAFREARNCGSKINSVGDEVTPFISAYDGKMYFSSNGHPSYGMFDIFSSSGQRSRWEEPENMGRPFNGPNDDLYFVNHAEGEEGFFVSNRKHPNKVALQACCDDLFYYRLLDNAFVNVEVKLNAFSEDDKSETISGGEVMIYTKGNDGELYFNRKVLQDGSQPINLKLQAGKNYVIKAQADNYLKDSKALDARNISPNSKVELSYDLLAISDKAYRLENIYYEFDDDKLTESAFITIDTTIYKILIENPEIIVELSSHTDSKGTEAYNMNLSQRRAQSVVKYLIRKGISKERLKAQGYGETQFIAPNTNEDGSDNPEGRALNRRTEFKVIGKINLIEDEDD